MSFDYGGPGRTRGGCGGGDRGGRDSGGDTGSIGGDGDEGGSGDGDGNGDHVLLVKKNPTINIISHLKNITKNYLFNFLFQAKFTMRLPYFCQSLLSYLVPYLLLLHYTIGLVTIYCLLFLTANSIT